MKKNLKVAIQGVRASFHDVAAQDYFKDFQVEPVECSTFKELCENLKNKTADLAVMAIENSIAGSILPNYTLLENYHFEIQGETFKRIELYLMAQKGETLKSLTHVLSHPMALAQSTEFLNTLSGIRIIEAADTAESAKDIRDKNLKGHGAIASLLAAKTYGLEVLASSIETNKQNYTRFLIIGRWGDRLTAGGNKASIRFELAHQVGSLVQALEIIQSHGLNMTKIQSVPVLGKPYQYSFHVDMEFEKDSDSYSSGMAALKKQTQNLIEFGIYPRGERPVV